MTKHSGLWNIRVVVFIIYFMLWRLNFRSVFRYFWGLIFRWLPEMRWSDRILAFKSLIEVELDVFEWWDNFLITSWFNHGYNRGYVAFIKYHFSNFSVAFIFCNHRISQIITIWFSKWPISQFHTKWNQNSPPQPRWNLQIPYFLE